MVQRPPVPTLPIDPLLPEIAAHVLAHPCLVIEAAPGAGKTSVLEKTLRELDNIFHPAVIEGDLYTTLDTDRIQAIGVPAYQITTGTCCHLDARMIARGLARFPVERHRHAVH